MEEKSEAPASMLGQVLKSICCGLLGGTLGVLAWFLFDENTPRALPILIGVLGIAAGVGLTLPGVSAKRVSKGVVAGIVAKPLPGPLRSRVVDALMREEEEQPPPPPVPNPTPPDNVVNRTAR